jgi:DNA repair protein RecO (recombination protein O)
VLHSTKGIVLRNVKYGETSLIVTIYTELFGVQSYLVNGVRTERKSASKANVYQPTTLLDLVVYHHPNKNLQRIKEVRIQHYYQQVYHSFIKNTIAIYVAELISKTISEPETNAELFDFFLATFLKIDVEKENTLANLPIEFTLHLASHLGFGIQNKFDDSTSFLDLQNGLFCNSSDLKSLYFIEKEMAQTISQISHNEKVSHLLNQQKRTELLGYALQYLKLHIPHLGELRSVHVLHQIMN